MVFGEVVFKFFGKFTAFLTFLLMKNTFDWDCICFSKWRGSIQEWSCDCRDMVTGFFKGLSETLKKSNLINIYSYLSLECYLELVFYIVIIKMWIIKTQFRLLVWEESYKKQMYPSQLQQFTPNIFTSFWPRASHSLKVLKVLGLFFFHLTSEHLFSK